MSPILHFDHVGRSWWPSPADWPLSGDQTTTGSLLADAEGALHGFQWAGQDTLAGQNGMFIVLEVPEDILGADPGIGA